MTLRSLIVAVVLAAVAGACVAQPTSGPAMPEEVPSLAAAGPTPVPDDAFLSSGGGEPRSAGYWLLWNACAPGNRAQTARANGGRAAGWILVDDLLQDPGILLGELAVETCPQGLSILQQQNLSGTDQADDPVYQLAAQLLVAQLNLASGAESCPAVEEAVQAGQLLLLSLDFDGEGFYLPPGNPNLRDRTLAGQLTDALAGYNGGALCVP